MNDGAARELIEQVKNLRAELNQNSATVNGAMVHFTTELFLLRKVLELSLPPEAQAAFQQFAGQRPAAPQAPDLRLEEPARAPTQAEIDEINRALNMGDLEVSTHGLPAQSSALPHNAAQLSARRLP